MKNINILFILLHFWTLEVFGRGKIMPARTEHGKFASRGRWNLSESKRFDHSRQFRIINSVQLLTELKQLAAVLQTAGNVIQRIIRYPSNKMYWLDSNLRSSVLFFGGARKCDNVRAKKKKERLIACYNMTGMVYALGVVVRNSNPCNTTP